MTSYFAYLTFLTICIILGDGSLQLPKLTRDNRGNILTSINSHGEVVVKSSSAKLHGHLPHGYSPITSETTHLLDPHYLHPVILIPDIKKSPLEGTVVKNQYSLPFCKNKWDYFDIWFKVYHFRKFFIECWALAFRLHYDPKLRRSYSTPGVTIRPKDFGSVYEVEDNVIQWKGHDKEYMKYLVEAFVGLGYIKNQNLLAATYDWRYSPSDNPVFCVYFEKLIEVSVTMNNRKPAILVCHGAGCLYVHYFLSRQPTEWKYHFVKALIAIGTPWGGSFHHLYTYLDKDDDPVTVSFPDVRYVERTFSFPAYLLPHPTIFPSSDNLVQTLFRNYSANEYKDLFTGLGYPNAYNMWLDSYHVMSQLPHPEVDVFILNGIGFKTMESVIYSKAIDVSDEKNTKRRSRRKIIYGNGDGKVNAKSGRRCLLWASHHDKKFHYTEFLASHENLVKETHPVSHIINIVSSLKFDGHHPEPEGEPPFFPSPEQDSYSYSSHDSHSHEEGDKKASSSDKKAVHT